MKHMVFAAVAGHAVMIQNMLKFQTDAEFDNFFNFTTDAEPEQMLKFPTDAEPRQTGVLFTFHTKGIWSRLSHQIRLTELGLLLLQLQLSIDLRSCLYRILLSCDFCTYIHINKVIICIKDLWTRL